MNTDINIEVLEGAAYRIYLTLRGDDDNALLDTALYDVYGGLSNGRDKVIADVEPCGAGRVLVTFPPGAVAGYSWDYQVCIREKASGYEWVAVQGAVNVLQRVLSFGDACISPPAAEIVSLLSPQELHCEATLVAWNGEVLQGDAVEGNAPVNADAVRALIEQRLSVKTEVRHAVGDSTAGERMTVARVDLLAPQGLLTAVELPAVGAVANGDARLLRVQVWREDEGVYEDVAASTEMVAQTAGLPCRWVLGKAVQTVERELRLLWVDSTGSPAAVEMYVEHGGGVGKVQDSSGADWVCTPCVTLCYSEAADKYATAAEVRQECTAAVENAARRPQTLLFGGDDNRGVGSMLEWAAGVLPEGLLQRLTLRHSGLTHAAADLGGVCAVLLAVDGESEVWLATGEPVVLNAPGVIYDVAVTFAAPVSVPADRAVRLVFIAADAAAGTAADAAAPRKSLYLRLTTGCSNLRLWYNGWLAWFPWVQVQMLCPHADDAAAHLCAVASGVRVLQVTAAGGAVTRLYLLAAGSAAAAQFTGGAAGLGFTVEIGGNITARGCRALSALLTDHSADFTV